MRSLHLLEDAELWELAEWLLRADVAPRLLRNLARRDIVPLLEAKLMMARPQEGGDKDGRVTPPRCLRHGACVA